MTRQKMVLNLKTTRGREHWLQAFKIDVLKCESCAATLVPLGVLKDPQQIARYLGHVGIDPMPPARAPPRFVQELLDFDQQVPGFSEHDG